VNREGFSPASLAAGLVLVAIGAWVLIGGVTFDALLPALLGGLGVILLASGMARRR
jgi:hypothetical protein